jgi:very-short-patch-repair endonuclease
VIEIDGDSHGETQEKVSDKKRTAFLKSKGFTVLRFTNPEVNKNIEGVMEKLEAFIEKRIDVNHPDPLWERGGKNKNMNLL